MISLKGRHFPRAVILMAVRWYTAYSLSYRDVEEMMLERGTHVDHATLNRWVVEFSPKLEAVFRRRHKRKVSASWRMDETYIKVKGKWCYYYRAVDKYGKTLDFWLSETRNRHDALAFFEKTICQHGLPEKVTVDKSGANAASIKRINLILALLALVIYWTSEKVSWWYQIIMRQIKYLNNLVEQDHRFIKKLTKPTMGFKAFQSAAATLTGIELHHMLRKGQHTQSANQSIFQQFYALAA
jgi:putative transposase